ncbi:MAG: hypothetical protein KAQ67_07820, partial [Gammaproteobacteria bacterium]|nr:hypothetical protein [Gammaproteobacteria bacterium]
MGKHTTSQNTEFQNKLDDDPLSPIESISENNEEIETFEKYNSMDDIDDSPSEDKNSEIEIENLLQKIADDESDSLIYTDNDITDTIGTDEETETDLLQSILGNEDEDEHDQSPQVDISNLLTGLDNDTIETADAIHDEAETDLLQNILGDEYQDDQPPKADDNISLTDNDITDTVETDNETDLLQSILGNKDEDEHDQSPQVDISSLLTGLDNDTLEAADAIHDEAETDLLQNILGDEYQDDQPPK